MKDKKKGTGGETLDDKVTLFWKQKQFHKTINLDSMLNVATMRLAPGFNKFEAFCAKAGINDNNHDKEPIVIETNVVSNDEADTDEDEEGQDEYIPYGEWPSQEEQDDSFDLNGATMEQTTKPIIVKDEEER